MYLQDAALFNQAVLYTLGKVGVSNGAEGRTTDSNTVMARMCSYGYIWPSRISIGSSLVSCLTSTSER